MTRRTALWLIAALLGIVASAVVAWTASRLAAQRIGLSSAPASVVRGLAPAAPTRSPRRHARQPGGSPTDGFPTAGVGGRPTSAGGISTTGTAPGPVPGAPRDDSSGSRDRESSGPDD